MSRNLSPVVERLALLTDADRLKVYSILDILAECGWPDFPSRAVWELKLKQKRVRVDGKRERINVCQQATTNISK